MRYIYCHPLFDERKYAQRFSFHLKEAFRATGLALERFDYRGTGDSAGSFADVSLETLRQDIASKIGRHRVYLIGLRFGASLAFEFCAHRPRQVRTLVILEPLVDGEKYVDYLFRKQHIKDMMTGKSAPLPPENGYENIEGYKTSRKFIEQLKNFNLAEIAEQHAGGNSIPLMQIANSPARDGRWAKSLAAFADWPLVENIQLPPFWERIGDSDYSGLTQKIVRWCGGKMR